MPVREGKSTRLAIYAVLMPSQKTSNIAFRSIGSRIPLGLLIRLPTDRLRKGRFDVHLHSVVGLSNQVVEEGFCVAEDANG